VTLPRTERQAGATIGRFSDWKIVESDGNELAAGRALARFG
jgi:hypothetical protein